MHPLIWRSSVFTEDGEINIGKDISHIFRYPTILNWLNKSDEKLPFLSNSVPRIACVNWIGRALVTEADSDDEKQQDPPLSTIDENPSQENHSINSHETLTSMMISAHTDDEMTENVTRETTLDSDTPLPIYIPVSIDIPDDENVQASLPTYAEVITKDAHDDQEPINTSTISTASDVLSTLQGSFGCDTSTETNGS